MVWLACLYTYFENPHLLSDEYWASSIGGVPSLLKIAVFLQEDETGATEAEMRGLGPCGPHLEGVRSAHTCGP